MSRAAAAGGVTTVVDMPLNSIPATTTLESKRAAARGRTFVDEAGRGHYAEAVQIAIGQCEKDLEPVWH